MRNCEIMLNWDQWLRRCRLKVFLISGDHILRWSKTICARLVEVIMRKISVKLF